MSEKVLGKYWAQLGTELGRLEKITKTDIHFCDTVLPIVEKIELRARIEEEKKFDKIKVGKEAKKKNG